MAPLPCLALLALLLLSSGCDDARAPAALLVTRNGAEVGGHLPPAHALTLRTANGVQQVTDSAYYAALGPQDAVAYVDSEGLHLWRDGKGKRVAKAAPRGLAANVHGVVFTAAAESGPGSGIAWMSWDGTTRALIAAPEGLPGMAGYLKPSISPDGRYVIAFSDLTVRPSVHRVDVSTGAVTQLLEDAPGAVGEPAWTGDEVVWSTGDGRAALNVTTGSLRVQ